MMRVLLALSSLLWLTGCLAIASPQEIAQQDDAVCRSYGAAPGTDGLTRIPGVAIPNRVTSPVSRAEGLPSRAASE